MLIWQSGCFVNKSYLLFSFRAFKGYTAKRSVPKNNIFHGGLRVPLAVDKDLTKYLILVFKFYSPPYQLARECFTRPCHSEHDRIWRDLPMVNRQVIDLNVVGFTHHAVPVEAMNCFSMVFFCKLCYLCLIFPPLEIIQKFNFQIIQHFRKFHVNL